MLHCQQYILTCFLCRPIIFSSCETLKVNTLTINVPLFKKLRDIIFFLRDNHFMSHFREHFEGAKTFLTPKIVSSAARDNLGVKKVEAPSKCPEKWLIK